MKLSVFMIVKNEEKNLARALESVRWADEIIVVDSLSTDRTAEIAAAFTKRENIFVRTFTDYADQKNFAMSKAAGDWLLSLDADEEVTPELAREIRTAVGSDAPQAAYRIRRRSQIFGRWFRFTGTQDDKPVRLWKRGAARFEQPIHERVAVTGKTGEMSNVLLHYTYADARDYFVRLNDYTSREAELLAARGVRPGFVELNIKPFTMFFKLYFLRSGFLDGGNGFLFSAFSAFYVFLKYAKLREKQGTLHGA